MLSLVIILVECIEVYYRMYIIKHELFCRADFIPHILSRSVACLIGVTPSKLRSTKLKMLLTEKRKDRPKTNCFDLLDLIN